MTASTGEVNFYTQKPKVNIDSPANPELKWEKTATYNLGIDFSLFDHRLRGAFDWYNKKGTDIFSLKSLDVSKGFTSVNMNLADMKNNGYELALSYDWFQELEAGDFNWTTSVTMAYNKNEITSMEVQATSAYELVESGFKAGYPTSALFSYRRAELSGKGQPIWWTADGRKVEAITVESVNSLVYSEQSDPKVSAAMENTLHYKGFSLNFMMVYYGVHKMRVRQYNQIFTFGKSRLFLCPNRKMGSVYYNTAVRIKLQENCILMACPKLWYLLLRSFVIRSINGCSPFDSVLFL